jgi:hypothetical protein
MRKVIGAVLTAGVAGVIAFAPQAWATGGTYPSNAPTVTPGSTVSGGNPDVDDPSCAHAGHNGTEYYRVNLGAGDHLIADLTDITGQGSDLCLFAPSITDYTIANSNYLTSVTTSSTHKVEMTYIAPTAGSYLLAPSAVEYGESWGYSMIVNVLHGSQVSASGPSAVKVGHKIKITGQANAPGQVTLQLKSGGWQTVGQRSTTATGAFKFALRATHTGLAKFRVLFGANGYLGSRTSKIKVRVHH